MSMINYGYFLKSNEGKVMISSLLKRFTLVQTLAILFTISITLIVFMAISILDTNRSVIAWINSPAEIKNWHILLITILLYSLFFRRQ